MKENNFLASYVEAFDRIEGWCSLDAMLMFMAYNEIINAHEIAGDALEIGVHHGRSAIAIAALRGDGARFVAVDLFDELQEQNVSGSGGGSRASFVRNMTEFFGDIAFVQSIAAPSNTLDSADLGDRFSFCHIDGGHTASETYEDIELCSRILLPGGLLALDDYFNPAFPGVSEGAIKFWLAHEGTLTPIAAAFNKVLFQKAPAPLDLNAEFNQRFPYIPYKTTTLWETPIHSFSSFRALIDTQASNPRGLRPNESFRMDAVLTLEAVEITASGGGTIHVPVRVVNRSRMPFAAGTGEAPIGLSYHLLSGDGRDVKFNNARSYFWDPLAPDEERIVQMPVDVPEVQGDYQVEADIVWEGITWLKNQGLATPRLRLTVI